MVARYRGKGNGELMFNVHKLSLGQNLNILKMEGGAFAHNGNTFSGIHNCRLKIF